MQLLGSDSGGCELPAVWIQCTAFAFVADIYFGLAGWGEPGMREGGGMPSAPGCIDDYALLSLG